MARKKKEKSFSLRNIFAASGLPLMGVLVAGLLFTTYATSGKTDKTQQPPTGVKRFNMLGNTGLKVSEIGLGAGGLTDPVLVKYSLDNGINYFDTAETYARGKSESAIGEVAAKDRKRMIICTKLNMNGETKQKEILKRYEKSLQRLQTSYSDILMIHGGNKDAVDNPEIYAAFDQLKKEKKLRFTGVSHHGPNMTKELWPIVKNRKVDVILLSYDPAEYADLKDLLKAAEDKGIGLVAMKVFSSARKAELKEFKSGLFPFDQAALRWVLKDPYIDVTIPSMNVLDQIDEYVKASGVEK
ncbi:aldo/keto reductase [Acidobacteriota bacterium]